MKSAAPRTSPDEKAARAQTALEEVSIQGRRGILKGTLHLPANPRGNVVLSHCFTCNRHYRILVHLGRALAGAGFATLRFDYSGLGESDGDFAETNVTTDSEDLRAATEWLLERCPYPTYLIGHSMGGAVGLIAAAELPSVGGFAFIGSSSHASHLRSLLALPDLSEVPDDWSTEVAIGGKFFPITRRFMEELDRYSLPTILSRIGRPTLFLYGTADETVPIEQGEQLFTAARQPKSFHALDGADHLLTRRQDMRLAAVLIVAWLDSIGSREK